MSKQITITISDRDYADMKRHLEREQPGKPLVGVEHFDAIRSEPVAPIVHLNGTSKGDLTEQLREVADALKVATFMVRRAWPNGRDYYVHEDPNALTRATEQWEERLNTLKRIRDEVMAVYLKMTE